MLKGENFTHAYIKTCNKICICMWTRLNKICIYIYIESDWNGIFKNVSGACPQVIKLLIVSIFFLDLSIDKAWSIIHIP